MTAALRKIVADVQALGADERRELQALLRSTKDERSGTTTEQDFVRKLAAKGVASQPVGALPPVAPVPIVGKPVSEMIVEERQ